MSNFTSCRFVDLRALVTSFWKSFKIIITIHKPPSFSCHGEYEHIHEVKTKDKQWSKNSFNFWQTESVCPHSLHKSLFIQTTQTTHLNSSSQIYTWVWSRSACRLAAILRVSKGCAVHHTQKRTLYWIKLCHEHHTRTCT